MSPSLSRKNGNRKGNQDDESRLILASPTSSDGEHNAILNGNDWHNPAAASTASTASNLGTSAPPEVGFAFPNVKLKSKPVSHVRANLGDLKIIECIFQVLRACCSD